MKERIRMPELRSGFSRWPRGRKIEWYFQERFSAWLLESVELEMRGGQYYTAMHLMLLGIEVLGGFLEGRAPDRAAFSAFVARYMGPALRARVGNPFRGAGGGRRLPVADVLWESLRRGYRDACAGAPGVSLAPRSHYYVRCYARIGVRIDARAFHRDFASGCKRYYADVYSDYLVRQRFLARFDQLFGGRGKAVERGEKGKGSRE